MKALDIYFKGSPDQHTWKAVQLPLGRGLDKYVTMGGVGREVLSRWERLGNVEDAHSSGLDAHMVAKCLAICGAVAQLVGGPEPYQVGRALTSGEHEEGGSNSNS